MQVFMFIVVILVAAWIISGIVNAPPSTRKKKQESLAETQLRLMKYDEKGNPRSPEEQIIIGETLMRLNDEELARRGMSNVIPFKKKPS